jgi:hypothetical protein
MESAGTVLGFVVVEGLAETAYDSYNIYPVRQNILKIERWMIHSVLVFSFVMTIAVIFSFLSNNPEMSFITKTILFGNCYFPNRFLQEHYIYLKN